jgi:hypothetical protein
MQDSFASGCVTGMWTRDRLRNGSKYLRLPTTSGNALVLGHNSTAIQVLDQPYPTYLQSTTESDHFVIHTINYAIPDPISYSQLSSAVISDALYRLQQETEVSNQTIEAFEESTIFAPCDEGIAIYRDCALSWGLTPTYNDFVNIYLFLCFS